ncbi:rod shape-determining protein RodA [Hazenella coriacea]|uniref:Peptidoglycan glycosyltransferase RodA n=1 Tax=Hazenella coriacea TaxID=1179467 RepID=A0A4V2UV78_9BACL|nr:rod shape-determining protein RodA [Hazenella coriacea]TCS94727.1 rod shape determining protein RodA [Hazenella coriacea]
MKPSKRLMHLDFMLILILFILGSISIVAISSATYTSDSSYVEKQIGWYILGFLCMLSFLLFDLKILSQGRFLYLLYIVGILLLILVFVPGLGVKVKGAQQWIRIGSFQLQPSELMKLIFILLFGKVLAERSGFYGERLRDLGKLFILLVIPFLIILSQPDLGTALVFIAITVSMCWIAGMPRRWFLTGILTLVLSVGSVFTLYFTDHPFLQIILKDHQIKRIETFVNPAADPTGAGYQLTQAKIGIGSGSFLGKGWHQGTQVQGNWIPEPHNDFIFAVFAEEFGFLGASLVIVLFLLMIYRMIMIAFHAEDPFQRFVVTGVIGMISFQVIQNIGMTVGLLPITGLPLPFISYGGSSLVTQMIGIGFVLNVGIHQQRGLIF